MKKVVVVLLLSFKVQAADCGAFALVGSVFCAFGCTAASTCLEYSRDKDDGTSDEKKPLLQDKEPVDVSIGEDRSPKNDAEALQQLVIDSAMGK